MSASGNSENQSSNSSDSILDTIIDHTGKSSWNKNDPMYDSIKNPELVSDTSSSIGSIPDIDKDAEEMAKRFNETKQNVGNTHQEVTEEESEAKNENNEVKREILDTRDLIVDSESKGDTEELDQAENEVETVEKTLDDEEQNIEDAEENIEREINLEEKQEQIIAKLEKESEQLFQDVRNQKFRQEFNRLKNKKRSENAQITGEDYQRVESILKEYQEAATFVNESTQMISELMDEIGATEKDEARVEKLSGNLANELKFMDREIAELERDYSMLKDQKHEALAEKEEEKLKEEKRTEKKEIQEERKIDSEIRKEINKAEDLVREDEALLENVEKSISDLRNLYELLQTEKNLWKFSLNSNPPLKDIENTINQLQEIANKDEKALKDIEKEDSTLRNIAPSGPENPSQSPKSGYTYRFALIGLAGAAIYLGYMYLV